MAVYRGLHAQALALAMVLGLWFSVQRLEWFKSSDVWFSVQNQGLSVRTSENLNFGIFGCSASAFRVC